MLSIWDTNFVVVDVETTGSHAGNNRVMDIACVVVRGGEIVHEFSSLVNPRQFIPEFIANMTGISNAMVFGAPEADEVFPKVHELLSQPNTVFVAHNAQFDWSFVEHSFSRANLPPVDVPILCTVKLARRLLPGEMKKNLGALAKHYGIHNPARHRALGDTMTTARVLLELLNHAHDEHDAETLSDILALQTKLIGVKTRTREQKRLEPFLDKVPDEPGVYYMRGRDEGILYIGKAKSLKSRVRSYFQPGATHEPKIAEMVRLVHSIHWEVTDTELGALLLESKEIKTHKPNYNTLQKKLKRYPFLKLTVQDNFPRLEFAYAIEADGAEYFGPFKNRELVEDIVDTVQRTFKLRICDEDFESNSREHACIYYQMERCGGACAGIQTTDEYHIEVAKVRSFLSGLQNGLVEHMEREMHECAERLDFETAAKIRNRIFEVKRLLSRPGEVPAALNYNNLVLILPASEREKTVELFFIKAGRLIHQETIGRKAPLARFKKVFQKEYFSGEQVSIEYSKLEVDEVRIITSWLYRQRYTGHFLYLDGKISAEEFFKNFELAVRNSHVKVESEGVDSF